MIFWRQKSPSFLQTKIQTAEEFLRLVFSKKYVLFFRSITTFTATKLSSKKFVYLAFIFPLKPFVYKGSGQVVCQKTHLKSNPLWCSFLVHIEPCNFKGLWIPLYFLLFFWRVLTFYFYNFWAFLARDNTPKLSRNFVKNGGFFDHFFLIFLAKMIIFLLHF